MHTEKLDGENNCLNRYGVFARSHAAPTQSAWTYKIRQRWQLLKNDLGDLELFGENLYAVHSIEYRALEQDFYLFAVRCQDMWLSWEEVQFYAALFDFPCVPEISGPQPGNDEKSWQRDFLALTNARGAFDPGIRKPVNPVRWKALSAGIVMRFPSLNFRITSSSMCAKIMSKLPYTGNATGNGRGWPMSSLMENSHDLATYRR